jgi:hypothetical protein
MNSGTYEVAKEAVAGLDNVSNDLYQCSYEFEYECDGIIIHNGPNYYGRWGSYATGQPCALAFLHRTVCIVLGVLIGAW